MGNRFVAIRYDAANEFAHIQYLPAVLETRADVAAFAAEIDREMGKIGKKVDVIVDLGELVVRPTAVELYDVERQRMMTAYARRAYRYHGVRLVRTRIMTSSTLHGQAANVFESFEQARAAMLADRG